MLKLLRNEIISIIIIISGMVFSKTVRDSVLKKLHCKLSVPLMYVSLVILLLFVCFIIVCYHCWMNITILLHTGYDSVQ